MTNWKDQVEEDAKRTVVTPKTGLSVEAKITIAVVVLVAAAGLCFAVVGSAGIGYLGAAAYTFFTGG